MNSIDVTIYAWPQAVECSERRLKLATKTSRHVSPITRTTQSQEMPAGLWTLSLSFPPLDAEQQRIMRVWLAKLRGMQGYFYFPADDTTGFPAPQPFGQVPETTDSAPRLAPQVVPGQLCTRGWTEPEGTLLLARGEYVSYDDANGWRRLHMVTADCYAAADGTAQLAVEPPPRYDIIEDTVLEFYCPSGVFKLLSDEEGALKQTPGGFAEMTINAIEAVPPTVFVPDA